MVYQQPHIIGIFYCIGFYFTLDFYNSTHQTRYVFTTYHKKKAFEKSQLWKRIRVWKKYYTLNHLNKSIQRIESDKSNIHVKHYWMFNFHPSWVKMLSSNVEKWPWNQNTLVLMDKKIKYSTVDLQFAFIRQGKKIISSAVVLEDASFFINSLCSITCVYFLTAP